jgi:hypothetical protein
MIISVFVCFLNLSTAQEALTASKVSGTIHYRNGDEVAFTEMGLKTTVLIYKVVGKLNAQDVTYYFSELSEIYFMEDNKGYYSSKFEHTKGKIRIVKRSGSPLILNDAYIEIGYVTFPYISYRYLDPVTNNYLWKESKILNNISYIIFNKN